MNHKHEFAYIRFFDNSAECECGDKREATSDELASERELIAESERKQMQDLDAHLRDLQDVSDAIANG
jgi:hypothetical protein